MSVVLNEEGLNFLFRHELGPVARHLDERGRSLDRRAHDHASGRPGPNMRSTFLYHSIRYPGLIRDEETGSFKAIVLSDAKSPRQGFPYPLAMELGMPMSGFPLPGNQRPYGPYPFLKPALEEEMSAV
jgi:hypothetical protein